MIYIKIPIIVPLDPHVHHFRGRRTWDTDDFCFREFLKKPMVTWTFLESHGSLNVPIEHHPTTRYMVYNGYQKR